MIIVSGARWICTKMYDYVYYGFLCIRSSFCEDCVVCLLFCYRIDCKAHILETFLSVWSGHSARRLYSNPFLIARTNRSHVYLRVRHSNGKSRTVSHVFLHLMPLVLTRCFFTWRNSARSLHVIATILITILLRKALSRFLWILLTQS